MIEGVPPRVLKAFEEIRKSEPGYVELKRIKGRYYVYRATSEWLKDEKRNRKVTRYLGAIDMEGVFIPRRQRRGVQESRLEVFEYGNGALAHHFIKDVGLEEFTPYWRELMASAIIRALDPKPLRLLKSRWEKLYLHRAFPASLSAKTMSSVLRETGRGVAWWYEFFARLTRRGDLLLYDLTAIFTYSKNIRLAERGYNPDWEYLDQIGVVLAFSVEDSLPVGVEVYWGSMKDITTLKDFLERFRGKQIGLILDRGFWSEGLLKDLRGRGISYLAPLRKDSRFLDLRWIRWRRPFSYRGRAIRWGKRHTELGTLYIFEDPVLRGEEEAALLRRVEKGEMTMGEFEEKRRVAGIIGLMSDLDKDGETVYDLYKGKQDVELAFDAMKNSLDADKTYLQTAEGVRGYFFVSFLALRIYFNILKRLREKQLTQKISVGEVLFELSKIEKIVEPSGREYFAKIPKRARKIAAIFPEALPMG
ncbi:MAG: transposase [Candidatus Bathyarchaeia archaeon]